MKNTFGRAMRRRFLLEPGLSHLNHGSFGTTPRVVLAAAERWRRRIEASPDRFMREILPGELRAAAAVLARFLGAAERDVALVENATSGMNAVLRSLRFRAGDEILVTSHVYNAVRQTLRHICARSGAKLVDVPVALPLRDEDALEAPIRAAFSRRTRLLVLDHIASPTGLIFPVQRLARFARARGVKVLVDGAHAPGQLALDVPALGADWYTGNCHKWLFAPKGCAFLWSQRGVQEDLHPTVISHGYQKGYAAEFDWTGTRDFSAWLAVPAALAFFRGLKPASVRAHNHRLVADEARKLAASWDAPLDGPPGLHGSMMAVRLPEPLQRSDRYALQRTLLTEHRVVAVVMPLQGILWARISAQVYNDAADYARLRDAVLRLARRR